MPNCKNCGGRISRFDKDICPICGTKFPLEGVNSETIEITSQINDQLDSFDDYHAKTKNSFLLLSIFLGWTGAAFFYIKYIKLAVIYLIINLVLIASLFVLLSFVFNQSLAVSIAITAVIIYFINIIVGVLVKFLAKNFKDGNGNFVR